MMAHPRRTHTCRAYVIAWRRPLDLRRTQRFRESNNEISSGSGGRSNVLILVSRRQNQQKSLNVTELLDQFRPLLTATILDEDEEHVLASCSYDRVRNLLQTRGCSNENRLRLWGLVLGLSSPADVSYILHLDSD